MSVVRRLLLSLSLLLVINNSLRSQDCDALANNLSWEFVIVSTPLFPGDAFFVECYVTGFTDLLTFQYSLNYNPNVLEFDSVDNTGSPLIGQVDGNFTPEAQETGSVPILWTNGNGEGQTLPPNTAIFKLFFNVIGDPEECSQWEINSSSVLLEVSFELPNGDICVAPPGVFDFNLTGGDLCIGCNDLYLTTNACGTTSSLGTLEFTACGGTAPYTYTVEGPGGTIDSGTLNEDDLVSLTNLDPGLYLIDLVDASGTSIPTDQGTIDIITADELSVEVGILQDVPCPGFTGDLIAVATGGVAPYIYSWSNGLFSDEVEDVPEGTYTVTVTDDNGCQAVATMPVVLAASPLNVTISTEDATCNGSNDGSISIFVTGGTPVNGDSYFFDDQLLTDGVFLGLNPGVFPIMIRDDKGCDTTVVVTLNATGGGTYDLDFLEEIECFGDVAVIEILGDVNQAVSLDTFPMIFDPNGGSVQYGYHPSTGNLRFEVSEPGMYEGYFFTNDGCEVEIEFEIDEVPEIVIDLINQEDFDCEGNGGDVEVAISGGAGVLSPMWSNGETELDITVAESGTYTLIVTDANMCSDSIMVEFSEAGSLGLTANVVSGVGCGATANAGSVEVTLNDPTLNVSYAWADAGGTDVGSTALVDGLGAGTYIVTVTDLDADCSATAEVTISGAGSFTFDTMETNPDCFGGDGGEIEVSIVGGSQSGPPTFAWSHDNNLSFNLAQDLEAGDYTVTVTDAEGCELDTTITLVDPAQIQMSVDNIVGVNCFNGADGSAIGTATDSPSGETEFTYFWENDTLVSTSFGEIGEPLDLVAGELIAYAYDGACFSDTITFEVPNAQEITLNSSTEIIDPSCAGLENGTLEINAEGGAGGLEYEWATGENTNILSDVAAGSYTVVVSDANNCEQSFDFDLTAPDSLFLELNPNQTSDVSCFGANTAVIAVFGSGGAGNYQYEWTPNVSQDNIAVDVGEGVYLVQLTDESGCTAELSYEVIASEPIVVTIAPIDPIPCAGGQTLFCIEEITGGSGGGYMYQMNFGNNTPFDECSSITAGQTNVNITDGAGCPYEETISIDVAVPEPITIDLGDPILELELGETDLEIDAIIDGPNPISTIIWSSDSGEWECLNGDCSSINISPTQPTFYYVEVTDENGCTTRSEVFVDIKTVRNVWAPNIFTPDRDGNNDLFHPFTGPGVSEIKSFLIYDRWGNKIHSAENIAPGDEILYAWDGRFNGIDSATGVYVFITEVEFVDGVVQFFKGSVTLTR